MAVTCAVMALNDVFKRADHCWQRLIKAWGGGLYEGWGVAGVFVRQDAAGGVAEKLLSVPKPMLMRFLVTASR